MPVWQAFTADWVVPPLPAFHMGQVVYFWPGFKSQQPEMGCESGMTHPRTTRLAYP